MRGGQGRSVSVRFRRVQFRWYYDVRDRDTIADRGRVVIPHRDRVVGTGPVMRSGCGVTSRPLSATTVSLSAS